MITWIADAVTGLSSFCSCLLAQLQLIPESSCTFQMLLKMEFFPKGSSWATELHRICHHLPKLMAATITLLLDMDIDGFYSSLAWRSCIPLLSDLLIIENNTLLINFYSFTNL
ncbi:unnamed protein product [Musa hybrid cultivar]